MDHEALVESFPCVESGCEGLIDPCSELSVRLNPEKYGTKKGVCCNTCSRLYGTDGEPVLNIEFMKVFIVGSKLEARNLTAVEKCNLVRNEIGKMCDAETHEEKEAHRRNIFALCGGEEVFLDKKKGLEGHTVDCEAIAHRASHMCSCGVTHTRNWFRDHADMAGEA